MVQKLHPDNERDTPQGILEENFDSPPMSGIPGHPFEVCWLDASLLFAPFDCMQSIHAVFCR
jgi:hypothetical protein